MYCVSNVSERCVSRGLEYIVESTLLHNLIHVHLRELGDDDVHHTGPFRVVAALLQKKKGYPHPILEDTAADEATKDIRNFRWRCQCGHIATFCINRKPDRNYGRHQCASPRWQRVVSIEILS